ncbi:hypothetical protein O0235_00815 [Tepidiforma flava]|uniref:DUF304 domain-containing protein n=1 Tax=Tepidiforma flava TaxID=3004094 RepID=A0ABY7M7R0_9CHLR|nr:hypothetical protein [Tepidiforma flava]WBL36192.1 hypothetical protein O0235_00815 [Tepidiforma flava]
MLAFVRRHWLYFSLKMAWIVIAGAGGAGIAIAAVAMTYGFGGLPGLLSGLAIAAGAAYWAVRGYFTWYRYQNDIWVVTNQRLVDSLKRHWFHHQMASTDLVDVEDLRVERHGVLQTLFDFGDVQCQTAGVVQNFVLRGFRSRPGCWRWWTARGMRRGGRSARSIPPGNARFAPG